MLRVWWLQSHTLIQQQVKSLLYLIAQAQQIHLNQEYSRFAKIKITKTTRCRKEINWQISDHQVFFYRSDL
ncbi:conserved hypothetical membrane domain protein [Mycoplasmoides gallisepticum str. F]|nr:conserved hypothetical membrane domain protein [Mycoplasmoides gallisepticum str. F]